MALYGPLMKIGDPLILDYAVLKNSTSALALLIQNPNSGATRVHIEPNGHVASGTVTKLDLMLDPYDDDPTYYRILNFYTQVGDQAGTGEPGIAVINVKNVGNHWGTWTSMHFGFQDDGENAVPMKLYLLDHSAPQHYTPHKGGWREGMAVAAGDHVTTLVAGVGRIYIAASTGTTGATVPSHGAGTVSDGGVSWTFVRAVSSSNVKPVVVIGERDDMPILGFPTVRFQMQADALQQYASKWKYLDADGDEGASVQSASTGPTDQWLYAPVTRGGGYMRYHMDENYRQAIGLADCSAGVSAPNNSTTPNVSGVEMLVLNNSAPTLISAFVGGKPGQKLCVWPNNNNSTLKYTAASSGGLIRNATEADIPLKLGGPVHLQRSSTADYWGVVGVGY